MHLQNALDIAFNVLCNWEYMVIIRTLVVPPLPGCDQFIPRVFPWDFILGDTSLH